MATRKMIPHVLALVAALALAPAAPAAAQAPAVPNANVLTSADADADVTITWVFRAGDLFSCRTVAYDLRQVLREHGGRVAVRAIAVDVDDALATSFIRRERLDGVQVLHTTEAQYLQAFGDAPSPAIYLSRQGQAVRRFPHTPSSWEQQDMELFEVVGEMLGTSHES